MKENDIYSSHRERIKNIFLERGFRDASLHNIIEMLLFYAVPEGDTKKTAHILADRYGSLEALFEASPEEIAATEGAGREAAMLIKATGEIIKLYSSERKDDSIIISCREEATEYMESFLSVKNPPELTALLIDPKGIPSGIKELPDKNSFMLLRNEAYNINAKGFFIFERRKSSLLFPQKKDIEYINMLSAEGKRTGFLLCDYIIYAGSEHYFMSSCPHFQKKTFAFG